MILYNTTLYNCLWFGDIDGPKPFELNGLGAKDVTKPYEFIWSGNIHGPEPYEFTRPRTPPRRHKFPWQPPNSLIHFYGNC